MKYTVLTFLSLILFLSNAGAAKTAKAMEVSGWYNDGWDATSHSSYMTNADVFTEINPFWYDLNNLTDGSINERSYAYTPQEVIDAHTNGDLVIPAIADNSSGQIDAIFANPTARANLINNIVNTVVARGYDGFSLDFESGTVSVKAAYTAFVNDLAVALHLQGKVLSIAIQAANSTSYENLLFFDYSGLGASAVDRIKIMTYDHNFDTGVNTPNPISPIVWATSVIDYAVNTRLMPPGKIHLGVHNYAWTWKKTGSSWVLLQPIDTYSNIQANSSTIPFQWNATAKEQWKQYAVGTNTYKSYVGTESMIDYRISIVNKYSLAGMSFYVLGREDTSIYNHLRASTTTNYALNKPATASSQYTSGYTALKATDGSMISSWVANPTAATATFCVDLINSIPRNQLKIFWGGYDWSVVYDVNVSNDNVNWTNVYHETNNTGGTSIVNLGGVSARYVQISMPGPKSDHWSYEMYEVQVF